MTRLLVLTAAVLLVSSSAWAQSPCVSEDYEDVTNLQLQALEDQFFTVCCHWNFREDADFALTWLRTALDIGRSKYGVLRPTYEGKPLKTILFLPPHETSSTSAGRVGNRCCHEKGDGYVYRDPLSDSQCMA